MIPHVERGKLIAANHQNDIIDRVNEHTDEIEGLKAVSGDPEAIQGMIDDSLNAHISSEAPHPAYDNDAHSFSLLFMNRLV